MPTRGQGNTGSARWQLKKLLDRPWTELAACVHHPSLPWVGDAPPNREDREAMTFVCDECPVVRQCTLYALYGNDGNVTDGGFYAGVYIPWHTYAKSVRGHRQQALDVLHRRLKPQKVPSD